jgi:glycosyltransferase involved in cell wall biosynthesis
MHVVLIMANNSSVPYYNWFASESRKHPEIKLSFIALHSVRPKMLDEMKAFDCNCYWIPFDESRRKRAMLSAIPKLYSLFRKIKPDIVHSSLFDDALPSLVASWLARIKCRVVTRPDTGFHWYFAPKAKYFDKINNALASHIVAISEESKRFLIEKEKADERKITLIHHGIDIEQLTMQNDEAKQRLKKQYGLENKIVVGTISRLIEWKGYRFIIEAAPALVSKYPNMKFLFVGTGGQKEELEALIKNNGMQNHIELTGWVDRADIPSLYGVMDIYLHAAFLEPFGFVIPEAMVNAVPIVSTKTGSAADSIEHLKSGYLIDYHSSEQISEGIDFMMTHDKKKIGQAGKLIALDLFPFSRMWKNHLSFYKQILGK